MAVTYPGPTTFPGPSTFPDTPDRYSWIFNPPTEDYRARLEGSLIATYPVGLNVWRIGGVWRQGLVTPPDEFEGADRFYGGGRVHHISLTERSALIAAGFGGYITYQEVTT